VAGPLLTDSLEAQPGGIEPEMLKMLGNFPVGRLDGFPLPRRDLEAIIDKVHQPHGD